MSDAKHTPTPSDGLQHIQFEGCDVCVIAPEDYDALVAALEFYASPQLDLMSFDKDRGATARAALKAAKGEA